MTNQKARTRLLLWAVALTTQFASVASAEQAEDLSQSVEWGTQMEFSAEHSIGGEAGSAEELFGYLTCVAIDRSGGVYVFDAVAPALRYFDRDGRFVRKVGDAGTGPGEYADDCQGLVVRRDGSVAMRDNRNMRIHIYDPDGTVRNSVSHRSTFASISTLLLGPRDDMFLKTVLGPKVVGRPWPVGLVRIDQAGSVVDTVFSPAIAGEPLSVEYLFQPAKIWTVARDGTVVVGLNESYVFEIRKPDSTIATIARSYEPASFYSSERFDYTRRHEWLSARRPGMVIPQLPKRKPAFRAIFVDRDDRLWVQLYQTAKPIDAGRSADGPPAVNWIEPTVYDVFDLEDGRYLGSVHGPDDFHFVDATGSTVWGRSKDSAGYHNVVWGRLRRSR